MPIRKVLIANRGEIACRIIRTCKAMGLATVGVYSQADAGALHVALADEAIAIGPVPAAQSYLSVDAVLAAARASNADAVHPGYGFLAESAPFARAVADAGRVWIGPRAKTIEDMGDKERARDIACACAIPVLPGSARFTPGDSDGVMEAAKEVGFPLLVKAAAGGGGIGMRRVDGLDTLAKEVANAQALAARAFADDTVYLKRYAARARHVEVQVFGFGDGTGVHLFERDCSVQRRYQKVIEEAPAPGLPKDVRLAMREAAMALVHQQRYRGAGTVEFIYEPDAQEFFFLEMNTRIQVEHAVTEMITGIDLIRWQIELAAGSLAPVPQDTVVARGAGVECRIYAERPEKRFLPSPGELSRFQVPEGEAHVRVDSGVREGDRITPHYDPLLAKVITRGRDRAAAIERMGTVLDAVVVEGVSTNLDFLGSVLRDPVFRDDLPTTSYVENGSYKELA
jgi:3-methylcrotonyl-CoA carboxylase alpha subunit